VTADPAPELLDWALTYSRRGMELFPVNPNTKAPLTENGFKDATSDPDRIRDWWHQHPRALIGCRVPEHTVILDIDPRHHGHTTWAALEKEIGAIHTGREHRSGRGDGGRHLWFNHPGQQLNTKALNEWARDHGVGEPVGNTRWTCGIDILHHDLRYTILPPSPHPETGSPYHWHQGGEPATMPRPLIDLLSQQTTHAPRPIPGVRIADGDGPADWYSANHSWHDILTPAGWVLVQGDGDSDGSKWRHPNASAQSSASVRHGTLFVYSPNTDFDTTEPGSPSGYTRFHAYAVLEHRGDMKAAASTVRRAMQPAAPATVRTPPTNINPDTGEILVPGHLDDTFWEARPALTHIRQAARSRLVAPAAVLGCVLAHVAAFTPPSTCLPPTVGSHAPLSTYIALRGRSGAGKSSPAACARDLLPHTPPGRIGPIALGSGEGLVEAFMDLTEERDDNGKTRKVKRQTRQGALFSLDEGQALAELAARKGSTIMSVLRTAWSGGDPGQANASIETRRSLKPGSYHVGLISLWQDRAAGQLLADVDGGTPQRFVWLTTDDTDATDNTPEWPGTLNWEPANGILLGGDWGRHEMGVDPAITTEVKAARIAELRGETTPDPLDSHRRLVKLKVAGLLALLDMRHNITLDDWELAERIMGSSDDTRRWIIAENARAAAHTDTAAAERTAQRDSIVEDAARARSLDNAIRAVIKVARKHAPGTFTRREVSRAIASRDRERITVDEALEHAETRGQIRKVDANEWALKDPK
jgi:hypothetical protein